MSEDDIKGKIAFGRNNKCFISFFFSRPLSNKPKMLLSRLSLMKSNRKISFLLPLLIQWNTSRDSEGAISH